MSDFIQRFTVAELIEYSKQCGTRGERLGAGTGGTGDVTTLSAAYDRALNGDASLMARASTMLDRIDVSEVGTAFVARPTPVVSGGTRVNVPAYLAGNPRCMVRRTKQETTTRHVNIFVSVSSSARVRDSDLLTRGAAVLGLLQALQQAQIGVDVTVFSEMGANNNIILIVPIESRPLDLSTASFTIAHPAFDRIICFNVGAKHGFNASWPIAHGRPDYETRLRGWLGAEPSDVVITDSHTRNIAGTPETWVEQQFRQIVGAA